MCTLDIELLATIVGALLGSVPNSNFHMIPITPKISLLHHVTGFLRSHHIAYTLYFPQYIVSMWDIFVTVLFCAVEMGVVCYKTHLNNNCNDL